MVKQKRQITIHTEKKIKIKIHNPQKKDLLNGPGQINSLEKSVKPLLTTKLFIVT